MLLTVLPRCRIKRSKSKIAQDHCRVRPHFAGSYFNTPDICLAPTFVHSLATLPDTARKELLLAEHKLGGKIVQQTRCDPDYLNDATTLEYLNNFGAKLVAARPESRGKAAFDYCFFAVRDPVLKNANW